MSGVELLPFVWALPVAYIVASHGRNSRQEQSIPVQNLNLEGDASSRWGFQICPDSYPNCDEEESIEVAWSQKGCSCLLV